MNPTLFISHGAPNMILSDLKSKQSIIDIAKGLKKAKYIIIVSAHYVTRDLKVINPNTNSLMYDFYGFEEALYNFKYEISSSLEYTNSLIEKLQNPGINISVDKTRDSFDHGVWTVLSLMYKKLEIPVIQLSIPISYSIDDLINLGKKLQVFKDEALLIFSGGATHNLRDMSYADIKPYAKKFNDKIKDIVENGKENLLRDIKNDVNFYKNHPSIEHIAPLFIAFGNAIDKKGVSFNSEMLLSNISMESFIFDKEI